jgi:MazG-like family
VDIRSAQHAAWQNKLAKGFGTADVPLEFCLLSGEVAEAFEAWHQARPDLGEELADVAIYLLGLAQMTGLDLEREVEAKLAKNAARSYRRLPSGAAVKVPADAAGDVGEPGAGPLPAGPPPR